VFCKFCGHQISEGANFCDSCGKAQSPEEVQKPKRKNHLLFWSLTLFCVVLAGRIIYVISPGEKHPPSASVKKEQERDDPRETARMLFIPKFENLLLERGFNAKVMPSGATGLVIAGPSIDRVFAYQLMSNGDARSTLKKLGFTTVEFWNGDPGPYNEPALMFSRLHYVVRYSVQ